MVKVALFNINLMNFPRINNLSQDGPDSYHSTDICVELDSAPISHDQLLSPPKLLQDNRHGDDSLENIQSKLIISLSNNKENKKKNITIKTPLPFSTESMLDKLAGLKNSDLQSALELSDKAIVEREMHLRGGLMAGKTRNQNRKSWPNDSFALTQNETRFTCLLNHRVAPVRPTNPQCRDPLFLQRGLGTSSHTDEHRTRGSIGAAKAEYDRVDQKGRFK